MQAGYGQNVSSADPFSAAGDGGNSGLNHSLHISSIATDSGPSSKKRCRWIKFEADVIPSLIAPYLQLLRESQSLRLSQRPAEHLHYHCNAFQWELKISCIYFDRTCPHLFMIHVFHTCLVITFTELDVCKCMPASLQLISRGLFPCTPTFMTLYF